MEVFSKSLNREPHQPEAGSTSTSCPSSTTNTAAGSNSSGGQAGNERVDPSKDHSTFLMKVDAKLWPTFSPEGDEESLDTTCPFIYFTQTLASQWAKGDNVGSYFGGNLFRANKPDGLGPDMLPPLLFDLVQHRVVRVTEIGKANYAVISHVWGHVRGINGLGYGVDWKIPIRNEEKLAQILEAARVVTGERYIWMDVLCMDQRRRNEHEIAKMKEYFNHATGCLVWLDNAFDEPSWGEVLSAVKEVNKFFSLDEFGTASETALETFYKDESFADMSMTGGEAFKWIKELAKVEKASWFKRVWTLQEAVIPENLFYCTPERYMTGGANLFAIIGLCERMAQALLAAGAIQGTAIYHELQRSEIYKMLKLRQLYRKREVSYWHLAQAIRTRECKYEQDKVFGVYGMIHGTIPAINYDRSIQELYQDLYKTYVEDGDFKPLLFLGGRSLLPDKHVSMGFISPTPANGSETHHLVLTPNVLRMDGIGIDRVEKVYYIIGHGPIREWGKKFPNFMDVGIEQHIDIARAFELDTDTCKDSQLCPAAFAAMGALTLPYNSSLMNRFDKEFQEMFLKNYPRALLMWFKFSFLQYREDTAATIIWTSASTPQVAVISEPLEGHVIAVMPSSYLNKPGPGCLLCKVLPNGNLRKIGIGLGNQVKATKIGTFNLSAECDSVEPTFPAGQSGINLDGIAEELRRQYGNDVPAGVRMEVLRLERLSGKHHFDPANELLDNPRPGERLKYETLYKHPMIAKTSFRLLNIWTTGTFPLISLTECPCHTEQKYIAISYAWGKEIETRTMFCDFQSYAVSAHVLAALNHLRYLSSESNREGVQLYWIDSICTYSYRTAMKHRRNLRFRWLRSSARRGFRL